MFIPESLRVNKFIRTRIPKAREYFLRYGYMSGSASGYSGDEEIHIPVRKVDKIDLGREYDEAMQREVDSAGVIAMPERA